MRRALCAICRRKSVVSFVASTFCSPVWSATVSARRREIHGYIVANSFRASANTKNTHPSVIGFTKWWQRTLTTMTTSDGHTSRSETERHAKDAHEMHALYEEQLLQFQKEREELFGFTEQDITSWGNSGGPDHKHSKEYMKVMESARSTQHKVEDENKERENGTTMMTDTVVMHEQIESANISRSHSKDQIQSNNTTESPTNIGVGNHPTFTHLSPGGDKATMVDVGQKVPTRRTAVATSRVVFPPNVMKAFRLGSDGDLVGPKGPIFSTAKLAGVMSAKKTSELIPLCHPLPLDFVNVEIRLDGNTAFIECECRVTHKTGVEMEALTGATVSALTVYDMVKAISHDVRIEATMLVRKRGGKRNVGYDALDDSRVDQDDKQEK